MNAIDIRSTVLIAAAIGGLWLTLTAADPLQVSELLEHSNNGHVVLETTDTEQNMDV